MSKVKLKHSSGNSMSVAAPATNPASDLELKLPATIGTASQVLRNSSTPGTLEFGTIATQPNDSVAKAWIVFKGDTSNDIADHYNIASVTDNGNGDYTFVLDTDFANINYCIAGNAGYTFNSDSNLGGSGLPYNYHVRNREVGSTRIQINAGNNGGVVDDANDVNVVWFGDQ